MKHNRAYPVAVIFSINLGVGFAQAAGMVLVGRHPLEAIEKDFLKRLHIGALAADAHVVGAGFAPIGLFTLVAMHHKTISW